MLTFAEFGELSDHTPIFADMEPYGVVMSWNMLTRCEYVVENGKTIALNNSWEENETLEQYHIRLSKVAEAIAGAAAYEKNLSLIALQEVPCAPRQEDEPHDNHTYFLKALCDQLDKQDPEHRWAFVPEEAMRMGTSRFGNLTLYRRDKFQKADIVNPFELSDAQYSRVLVTDLTPNETGLPPMRLANVHLKFYKPKHAKEVTTIEELTSLLKNCTPQHPMLMIGDFNRSWLRFGEFPSHVQRVGSLAKGNETRKARSKIDIDYGLFACWPGEPAPVWPGRWQTKLHVPGTAVNYTR